MKYELIENINQVFLQLEFTIKLYNYMKLRTIDKDKFDIDMVVTGKKKNISYSHGAFNTYDDLILAAENNVLVTIGCTFIVLDTSLESVGKKSDPEDRSPDGMLRSLIYMIRCAYAHNMMHPKWMAIGDYAQSLEIQLQSDTLRLDLSKKHNQPFKIKDIGGYENYYDLKELVCKMIS